MFRLQLSVHLDRNVEAIPSVPVNRLASITNVSIPAAHSLAALVNFVASWTPLRCVQSFVNAHRTVSWIRTAVACLLLLVNHLVLLPVVRPMKPARLIRHVATASVKVLVTALPIQFVASSIVNQSALVPMDWRVTHSLLVTKSVAKWMKNVQAPTPVSTDSVNQFVTRPLAWAVQFVTESFTGPFANARPASVAIPTRAARLLVAPISTTVIPNRPVSTASVPILVRCPTLAPKTNNANRSITRPSAIVHQDSQDHPIRPVLVWISTLAVVQIRIVLHSRLASIANVKILAAPFNLALPLPFAKWNQPILTGLWSASVHREQQVMRLLNVVCRPFLKLKKDANRLRDKWRCPMELAFAILFVTSSWVLTALASATPPRDLLRDQLAFASVPSFFPNVPPIPTALMTNIAIPPCVSILARNESAIPTPNAEQPITRLFASVYQGTLSRMTYQVACRNRLPSVPISHDRISSSTVWLMAFKSIFTSVHQDSMAFFTSRAIQRTSPADVFWKLDAILAALITRSVSTLADCNWRMAKAILSSSSRNIPNWWRSRLKPIKSVASTTHPKSLSQSVSTFQW